MGAREFGGPDKEAHDGYLLIKQKIKGVGISLTVFCVFVYVYLYMQVEKNELDVFALQTYTS